TYLAGRVVRLVNKAVVAETRTGLKGEYRFVGVPAGAYRGAVQGGTRWADAVSPAVSGGRGRGGLPPPRPPPFEARAATPGGGRAGHGGAGGGRRGERGVGRGPGAARGDGPVHRPRPQGPTRGREVTAAARVRRRGGSASHRSRRGPPPLGAAGRARMASRP